MRICSKPLFITNTLKLATNGIFPTMARPAPTPTMFASAMPQEKKRSGNSFSKYVVMVDFERSASTTTTRSEEHTFELQSLRHLVCRLLLEKKAYYVMPSL